MKRFLKIIGALAIALLLVGGGWLAARSGKMSASPANSDNAIWIGAGGIPVTISGSGPALEAEYLAAKADSLSLQQTLESAKHAIEDALPMVQEQKDNYDFAEERYNRLMPLVEKGTLDLMTASQIQSAYISARASLSQAKFYLGQAQREYGMPETRKVFMQAAESKVEAARQQLEAQKSGASVENSTHVSAGKVLALFSDSIGSSVKAGTAAQVTISGKSFKAVVRQVNDGVVTLDLAEPPTSPLPAFVRCRVVLLPK